jgi:outer membrane lipopolysaccharide assembly protein LptE/RlpB
MKYFLLLLLMPLTLYGCGYTPVALGPGIGVNSLYIEPMVNRTAEPFLDSLLTNSLVQRFGRDSRLTLVKKPADAEAVLSGTVSSYSRTAISYDQEDNILEYRSIMKVQASMRRVSDGKILWKDNVSWKDESMNSSDRSVQENNESDAIQEIVERLADHLYIRVHENF